MLAGRHDGLRRAALLDLAARQEGCLSRAQLLDGGVSSPAISRAVANGRLARVHPGAYAVGLPPRTLRGRAWAAVLAVGPDAAASRRTAAALAGVVSEMDGPIHVTVTGPRSGVGAPDLVVHRAREPPGSVLHGAGPPRTDLVWTLLDLAPATAPAVLRDAVRTAIVRGGLRPRDLRRAIEARRRPGARRLRAALDAVDDPGMLRTRDELEPRFLQLCIAHRFPPPAVNVPVAGYVVDFLWASEGIVVETDGWWAHGRRDRRAADRARDWELTRLGYVVLRVSADDLRTRPARVAAELRFHLHTRSGRRRAAAEAAGGG